MQHIPILSNIVSTFKTLEQARKFSMVSSITNEAVCYYSSKYWHRMANYRQLAKAVRMKWWIAVRIIIEILDFDRQGLLMAARIASAQGVALFSKSLTEDDLILIFQYRRGVPGYAYELYKRIHKFPFNRLLSKLYSFILYSSYSTDLLKNYPVNMREVSKNLCKKDEWFAIENEDKWDDIDLKNLAKNRIIIGRTRYDHFDQNLVATSGDFGKYVAEKFANDWSDEDLYIFSRNGIFLYRMEKRHFSSRILAIKTGFPFGRAEALTIIHKHLNEWNDQDLKIFANHHIILPKTKARHINLDYYGKCDKDLIFENRELFDEDALAKKGIFLPAKKSCMYIDEILELFGSMIKKLL
jgi:hypothetical protein